MADMQTALHAGICSPKPSDIILEQLEDGYRMDPPDGCPNYMYTIMEECWMMEPSQRPPFLKLREMLTSGDQGV